MKTLSKISVAAIALVFMVTADLPFLPVQLVPDADAIFGFWRRNVRRAVIIGGAAAVTTAAVATTAAASAGAAAAAQQTATAQQQAAVAQQQAAVAQQQAATAQQQASAAHQQAAASAGKPLPLGTVVTALPGGCTSTPVGGVEYYYCGGNFYRAMFQGNQLVYVTAQPK